MICHKIKVGQSIIPIEIDETITYLHNGGILGIQTVMWTGLTWTCFAEIRIVFLNLRKPLCW